MEALGLVSPKAQSIQIVGNGHATLDEKQSGKIRFPRFIRGWAVLPAVGFDGLHAFHMGGQAGGLYKRSPGAG